MLTQTKKTCLSISFKPYTVNVLDNKGVIDCAYCGVTKRRGGGGESENKDSIP